MGITIKEIAKLAGVSRGTVDRALKNSPNIKASTKQAVMKIVKDYDYQPNIIGQALAFSRKQFKVAVVVNSVGNDFFIDIIDGLNKGIAEYSSFGMSMELIQLKGFNVEGQLDFLMNFDIEKYSALIISAVDDIFVQKCLAQLANDGLCIVTLNSDVDFDGKIAYVGCDYTRGGNVAGGLVKIVSDAHCGLLIATGSSNILGHKQRVKGILKTIATYPQIKNYGIIMCDDDEEKSYNLVVAELEKNSEINVVCGASGGVVGAQRAADKLGRNIKIIAFDNTKKINELLASGKIVATINQQPFEQGYRAVKAVYDYCFKHIAQPKVIDIELFIKIKENL
ncbi:MAG: substrate-binding domain-containing protein [Clostridia bacterium]